MISDPPRYGVGQTLRGTRAPRDAVGAVERLVGGLGIAVLAAATLAGSIIVALACLVGIGIPLLPRALAAIRAVADRERRRLERWGHQLARPYQDQMPARWADKLRAARSDPATGRDLRWLVWHSSIGLVLGLAGILLPILAVRDMTFPLWWRLLPPDEAGASLGFAVTSWTAAAAVGLMGVSWAAILIGLGPAMARLQDLPGLRLLGPHPSVDMSQRIVELTATRARALQAHSTELRRIERALHDGTQNRLVGVAVLLGVARRTVARDPSAAKAALDQAQDAAELALAELRSVVRGILPPVLEDRGLAGALAALGAECAVPCQVTVDPLGDVPASVEATAYFVVSEALTNVSRHSHASQASVTVERAGDSLVLRIGDDGRGGAGEDGGTGLRGIRHRIHAHDGTMTLTSPDGGPTTLEAELPCGL